MNANVVSGVGRGRGQAERDEAESLMAHTVNETVYLGRASFRITHEVEAVEGEGGGGDSTEWFSHDTAVILKGGPSGLRSHAGPLHREEEDEAALIERPARKFHRSWLLVALPVAAFALGITVASAVGSGARRRTATTTAAAAADHAAPATVATTTTPAAAPVPAVLVPVTAPPPRAALPAGTATAVVASPVAAPDAVPAGSGAPGMAAATALPPSTVAMAAPTEAQPRQQAAQAVEVQPRQQAAQAVEAQPRQQVAQAVEPDPAPAAAPHPVRAVVKPHVVRKAKPDHAKVAGSATEDADGVPTDDAPAKEAAASAGAPKKAAVKWVDPWAN